MKYDGFRAISYIQRGRCNLVSRRGNVFARFDALGEQVASTLCRDVVAELGVDDAILDGEVITADQTGRPQFYDLLRRTLSPGYVAFDLLWQRCRPAAFAPQRALRRLHAILPTSSPTITAAVSVERRGRELFGLVCSNDLEGRTKKLAISIVSLHGKQEVPSNVWINSLFSQYSLSLSSSDVICSFNVVFISHLNATRARLNCSYFVGLYVSRILVSLRVSIIVLFPWSRFVETVYSQWRRRRAR